MLTLAQWITRLTKGYIKFTGKKPDKLAQLKIKMEAGQKVKNQEKVIQFPQERITDWTKPRPTEGPHKADVISSGIGKKAETAKTIDEDKFVADFMAQADRAYYRFVNETLVKIQNAGKDEQLQIAKDIINRKGMYHNLDEQDAAKILKSVDQNIKPVEPKAYGGIAGMLGERDGYHRAGIVHAIEEHKELEKDLNKEFRFSPRMWDAKYMDRKYPEKTYRPYKSLEDVPPEVLAILMKDPTFDPKAFLEMDWAAPGHTIGERKYRGDEKKFGKLPGGTYYGMSGEMLLNFPEFRKGKKGKVPAPFLDFDRMSNEQKAQIILHELRHKNILEKEQLYEAQPEWVKKHRRGIDYAKERAFTTQKGPEITEHPGVKYKELEKGFIPEKYLTGHELFNWFMDARKFGPQKGKDWYPYFDKILKDHWEPHAKEIDKRSMELKSKPEHLGLADGGLAPLLGEPTYTDGGRTGFKKGTKFDPKRRTVLKGIAALSTIPFIGKYFKWAKPLAKSSKVLTSVPIGNAAGMPAWFKPLVNKVIKEGDDVTKKFATKERELVHRAEIDKDTTVDVIQDLDTGNVRIEYDAADNLGYGPIQLDYKAGEVIEQGSKKGTKTKPEFSAVESEPRVVNWDGDIEFDGENLVSKVDDLLTDTTKLESYATNKKPTIKKLLESEKKKKYVNKINDDTMEQVEYIENKQGHMAPEHLMDEPIPDDFASGGRVPRSGGGIMKLLKLFKTKPETLKEFVDRRKFLQTLILNTSDMRNKRLIQEMLEENKKVKGFKFPDLAKRRKEIMGDEGKAAKDFEMKLQEILAKHSTKHATGGLAGMLGE